MNRQHTHADGTLLPRGQFPKRANVLLGADIELASSLIKNVHDDLAFLSVLLSVLVLTVLIAIPNALAPVALLEGVALLFARRTQLGRGLILLVVGFILSFRGFAERHDAELPGSRRRCSSLFG